MAGTENTERMMQLDKAWNTQDWDTFERFHSADTAVHWPAQPGPTRGRADHKAEAIEFFKTFPDNHLDLPYKVLFGEGDMTCSIARFTGTMTGPMKNADGSETPPTNKKFDIEFCTVAKWRDGEITEEKLFYDVVGMMKQIGLM